MTGITSKSDQQAVEGLLHADDIDLLVVHCSDTPDDLPLRALDIQEMHLGFGWHGIGYHQVICRDGTREAGRPEYWRGAHVKGVNGRSLGVCLIGRQNFTTAQMDSLAILLDEWQRRYPAARIVGHRDAAETHKTCPNFNVESWWHQRKSTGIGATMSVSTPTLPIRGAPAADAPLETVALFGETVEVLARQDANARIRLSTDSYEGWISLEEARFSPESSMPESSMPESSMSALTIPLSPTHRICATSIHVLPRPDVKSPALMRLSMGALVMVTESTGDWHVIALPDGTSGYIPTHSALASTVLEPDFVTVAERWVGVPYLWGGRSAEGIDCSGLIQLSLQSAGVSCPRDSGPQFEWARARPDTVRVDMTEARRGDLAFWPGHVGVFRSPEDFIHANAHHHAVTVETASDAIMRTNAASKSPVVILRLGDPQAW